MKWKIKERTKSMLNTYQGQQKTREQDNKGYDEEEKRVPKLTIRLGKRPIVIRCSDEYISNNVNDYNSNKSSVGSFNVTIADKVKLNKRGRNNTSDAELFKTISQSSLPGKKRRRKCSSASVSSSPASSSSLSSPPVSLSSLSSPPVSSPSTTSPLVEAYKAMIQSGCDESPIPRIIFDSRAAKLITVPFHDNVQCPSLNCEPYSAFDTSIASTNVSSYDLPSKKAKLLEHYPFVNEKKSSATSSLFDIHQLEVASYEEVSSVEPLPTSSIPVPPEFFGVNDVAAVVPATSMLQGINSTSMPMDKENPVLNTEKTNHFEICREEQKKATGVSLPHYDCLETNDLMELIDVSYEEALQMNQNTNFNSSDVDEYFSHAKELSVVKKRTDDYVDKMMDLAIEIEKQPNFQGISSKVNGLLNKDSSAIALSTLKHSTQARDGQNITDLKNRINSRNPMKITKQLSRSSTDNARDYKNTHDNNGVFRQENNATKVKRKAMDERCIVYVGNIPYDYSVLQLKKRFQKFGTIRDIQIKSKVRGDLNSSDSHPLGSEEMKNYGFITFSCNQEASDAIEGGNKGHELRFHLSFGARRQFVGEEYKDLDGIVAKNENSIYKHNSRSSFLPQNKEEDDFDIILKNAMKARGVKPQPFKMKCKA